MPQLPQTSRETKAKVIAAIPCFNTKPFIEGLICRARRHVDQAIVIDDGSHDRTGEAARAAGALVISNDTNRGCGEAIKSCFEAAKANAAKVLGILDGDGQHITGELAGKFYLDRDPLPAIALTTSTSSLTAIANDFEYETVFAMQSRGLLSRSDVIIGISTSSESPNVLRAMEEAKRCGAITVAFTGQEGSLSGLADYVLSIPSVDMPRIQWAHITAGHIICYIVEEALFNKE